MNDGQPRPGLSPALLRAAALLLALVACVFAPARAGAADAGQPTPQTEPRAAAAPARAGDDCPARPPAGVADAAALQVSLAPDTLWRPRGGEVQFTVSAKGATVSVQRIQVCMGWSRSPLAGTDDEDLHALVPAPEVRPIATGGSGALFGAVVPDLHATPNPWFHLLRRGGVGFTAVDTVPVADMVVMVTTAGGAQTTVMIPVGVTSVAYAAVLVTLTVAAFFAAVWVFVRRTPLKGRSVLLKMITSPDGYASLSQFQIMLWTVTVGASAVYVMVLSGNLIDLTDGTLVLLGIAGAAVLAARVPTGKTVPADIAPAPLADPRDMPPRWSDLVVVDGSIDLTRVQMLVFTLISAAFVALKVIVGYVIPEIPNNFLLLMGLSNGVYIAGRQIPDRGKPSTRN